MNQRDKLMEATMLALQGKLLTEGVKGLRDPKLIEMVNKITEKLDSNGITYLDKLKLIPQTQQEVLFIDFDSPVYYKIKANFNKTFINLDVDKNKVKCHGFDLPLDYYKNQLPESFKNLYHDNGQCKLDTWQDLNSVLLDIVTCLKAKKNYYIWLDQNNK